ncbi:monovalent cation/H(+) antiporter subunit G [Desulfobaculum bizertense]|uniref:Multisubunit sodium/proton antiporter, MrpG subunit n=1 Tax=Desulfobaculum bizertense DSM 18034 TaxID=1121442 RepID=A0A1T4W8Y7_9BACT|nr:monovalent cation/H(+) antiporter subunit G [Desulfobaculum bizertense]UIJ39126.1 monovalent cation/H(+) antiporter subunit G [Desulfobaculum bizertense]SKA73161.1 multisubunit sodium/proton antiporter, MrpG subunit [Desulfobaculum bizertense DSM 18034]
MIINIIAMVCLICGIIVFAGAALGILRFPDFYSRLHPAGKMDTLASGLMLFGLAVYNLHHFDVATLLTSLKIVLILVFVFIASPTATHALVDAGFRAGLKPWVKGEKRR